MTSDGGSTTEDAEVTEGADDGQGHAGSGRGHENLHSFNPAALGDGAADADTDGVPNWDEYVAGTDPQAGTDYPKVSTSAATPSGIAGTGSVYEWLDDGSATEPAPASVTSRCYRVRMGLPV